MMSLRNLRYSPNYPNCDSQRILAEMEDNWEEKGKEKRSQTEENRFEIAQEI